ncbi:MAG: archaellar assembly protein FlaJ [Candidatus Methanoperedens sp.]|nr:archaellar assembly protein FlaJ [Candidatus Methanoperedens sp.]
MNSKVIFHCLGMSQQNYVKKFVVPAVIMALMFPILILILIPSVVQGAMIVGIILVPLALVSIVLIYPLSSLENKKKEIDNNMHYFITHMGVLATSQMTRIDMLEKLSHTEAYGYLAKETGRIYALVIYWHVSFPVACRFIANRTPSVLFQDFLDRLAHSMQAGQAFEDFVLSEQTVVMNDFMTMYQDSLNSITMIKELFVSMCMSLIFIVAFAIIMPIITGIDSTLLLGGAIAVFVITELVLLLFARSKVPADRIWHTLNIETVADRRLKWSMPISLFLCMMVTGLMLLINDIPIPIMFALSLTPLLLTGLIARVEEDKIKRYDNNFSSFIRSLGGAAGSRSGLILESLKELTAHDFGPLSGNVNSLYKRLKTRLNTPRSWEHFAAGTGSNLIERFATMFVEGTNVGGKPALIGDIISKNFMSILSMRKLRYSSASSLIGVLYGITGGIAATLFLSLAIIAMLAKIFSNMSLPDADIGISLAAVGNANIPLMTSMLMVMMVCHSLISSILIRVVDGGHHFNTYTHFVGLVWVSALTAELTIRGMGPILGM